jgi:hypothetical protein
VNEVKCLVRDVEEAEIGIAIDLLSRFFVEEGFSGTPETIAVNTRCLWTDRQHWVALAWLDSAAVGVVTVTTMLYVEWGGLERLATSMCCPRRDTVALRLPWSIQPRPSAASLGARLYP